MDSFLSKSQVVTWRALSQVPNWEFTIDFSTKTRQVFAKLTPPCIPENEILIFCAPIASGFLAPDNVIKYVRHKASGFDLKEGAVLATASRLIPYHRDKGKIVQVWYHSIKAVYTKGNNITLQLVDGSQMEIEMKVAGGLLDTINTINPKVSNYNRLQLANEIEGGRNLINALVAFFTEIVDTNRG